MPPSPLLSARSATHTYLMVVCRVSVQMMQDNAPSMVLSSMASPVCRMAFITYRGDVPMSPNTMPKVTSNPKKLIR